MEIKPWWVFPENLNFPLEFYIEEEQEEFIFGRLDANLHRIEMHSQTFIQLKTQFTATGLTHVLVVGPLEGRQWLFHIIRSIGSWDSSNQARGQEMLQWVQSQPLTTHDLAFPPLAAAPSCLCPTRRVKTASLRTSRACPYQLVGCCRHH
nr:putative KHDC1-like protein [Vicugna pacos]